MAETTTPRLMAAAKEFNVGKDTLVDFLLGKGFSKDDLKPTSKLTEDMYRALVQEFQSDKVAKLKSDQIDLPKGSVETRKKKEEETVLFKKEIKKATPVEEPKEEPPMVSSIRSMACTCDSILMKNREGNVAVPFLFTFALPKVR